MIKFIIIQARFKEDLLFYLKEPAFILQIICHLSKIHDTEIRLFLLFEKSDFIQYNQ